MRSIFFKKEAPIFRNNLRPEMRRKVCPSIDQRIPIYKEEHSLRGLMHRLRRDYTQNRSDMRGEECSVFFRALTFFDVPPSFPLWTRGTGIFTKYFFLLDENVSQA